MLQKTSTAIGNTPGDFESAQPRRLVLALALLLVAFAGVLYRDMDFWFGPRGASTEQDAAEPQMAQKAAPKSVPAAANPILGKASVAKQAVAAPAAAAKKQDATMAKASSEPKLAPQAPPAAVVNRSALPPLDVDVVAGDTHHKLHPGSNAAKVELTRPAISAASVPAASTTKAASEPAASKLAVATNAAIREPIAADAVHATPASASADYPVLTRQSKVEGSVVLQAIIGADGLIQDIHVVSGPAILSSAAREAVRQWHFKPYLQNGQPVETKARITVNFTIKVAGDSAAS